MKHPPFRSTAVAATLSTAVALLGAAVGGAYAHGNVSCPAMSQVDKRPQMDLQRKLEAEGWKVRQVKNMNHCYEVYGLDDKGRRAEAFFDPKTFERVYPQGENGSPGK